MAGRIIVLAGPSCCGKTTLLRQLLRGQACEVAECCALGNPADWMVGDVWLSEDALHEAVTSNPDSQYILHYTIPYPSLKYAFRGYDKSKRLATLFAAPDVRIITLLAEGSNLVERVDLRRARQRERFEEGRISRINYLNGLWKLGKRRRMYEDDEYVRRMYERWAAYVEGTHARHFVVDVNGAPVLSRLEALGSEPGSVA